jgi:ferrochelatase
VFPLFAQHASSSAGTVLARVYRTAATPWNVPTLSVVPPFFDHPGYIAALAARARPELDTFAPDHVLLSFHGLPERHIRRADPTGGARGHCLASDDCCARLVEANRGCYRAQCHATARRLGAALDIATERMTVGFQSRMGRTPWIGPHTENLVPALARAGVRRLAVLCPGFVSDCLETLDEIGIRARDAFSDAGGEKLRLVPCLNDHEAWIAAAVDMVRAAMP